MFLVLAPSAISEDSFTVIVVRVCIVLDVLKCPQASHHTMKLYDSIKEHETDTMHSYFHAASSALFTRISSLALLVIMPP